MNVSFVFALMWLLVIVFTALIGEFLLSNKSVPQNIQSKLQISFIVIIILGLCCRGIYCNFLLPCDEGCHVQLGDAPVTKNIECSTYKCNIFDLFSKCGQ